MIDKLPNELQSPAPQPTILNSTAMTPNAGVVTSAQSQPRVFKSSVRMGIYDNRKVVLHVNQEDSKKFQLSGGTRVNAGYDHKLRKVFVVKTDKGTIATRNYPASFGGQQLDIAIGPAPNGVWRYTEMRYSYCPAVFNVTGGFIEIDVSAHLEDVPLDVEADTEVETDEVETGELCPWHTAEVLLKAQATLKAYYGDSLRYEYDDDGYIAKIDISLAKSAEAA